MTQKKELFGNPYSHFLKLPIIHLVSVPPPPSPPRFCLNALSSWDDCLMPETIETGIWKQWVAFF